ncbi:MAG: circularly permuted type 2 ATP-grasp protein, partial [Rhodoblastus sp.]|nr:circularly permuted type 2 ATP-grasp protein [Rhodoblastus sp.]
MGAATAPRDVYARLARWLQETPPEILASRRAQAELLFRRIGITFAVYGDKDAAERLIPFDIIPRLFARSEWSRLEQGLFQRVKALNMFLTDVYGKQEVLAAGIVPRDL